VPCIVQEKGETRTGTAFRRDAKCFYFLGAPCEGNSANLTSVQSYHRFTILFASSPAFQDPIQCMSSVFHQLRKYNGLGSPLYGWRNTSLCWSTKRSLVYQTIDSAGKMGPSMQVRR
jgi:hypothetical protein